LHGHNGKVTFYCEARSGELDDVGRVIDFSVIKSTLCEWLETNWDHKFLIWKDDPHKDALIAIDPDGVVPVPFNPTAENLADHLLRVIGPQVLPKGIYLTRVEFMETGKCGVGVKFKPPQYVRDVRFG
jgi:6-pyruvoyltetrahydropterin/6-carboxytetrahydropterin synthase